MPKVKEVRVNLKIKDDFIKFKNSRFISGWLEGVIINIKKGPVNIAIAPTGHKEIVLFEKINMIGKKYWALRTDTHTDNAQKFNFTQDKWAINDKLFTIIEGLPGSEVEIIFRYI